MNLEDMRIFLATVQTGSFTAAAEKLLMSKQYVSRRMAALESRFGVQLLIRNSRKLRVTDLGRKYCTHVERILGNVDEAEKTLSSHLGSPRGTLKISVPVSFGTRYLSPLIAEFARLYPEIRIQIEVNDLHVDLIGGDFDMAVRIGRHPDSTLIAHRLANLKLVACCSPAYAAHKGVPATPDDLVRHHCVIYGREARAGWNFQIEGRMCAIDVDGALLINNGEFVRDAIMAGLGIAMLPHFIVGTALRSGLLIPVLARYMPPPLELAVVYPRHRQGSPTIGAFLDFLSSRLEARPDWA